MPSLDCLPFALAITLLGAIFPDIDIPSKMQKLFYISAACGIFAAIFARSIQVISLIGVSCLIVAFLKHRTTTHNIWFLLSFSLIIPLYITYQQPNYTHAGFMLYLFFFSGCLSHVILDRGISKIKYGLRLKKR